MVIHSHSTLPPVLAPEPCSCDGLMGRYWPATPEGALEAMLYHSREWADWPVDAEVAELATHGLHEVTTAGAYRDSHEECTANLVGHDGVDLDDDTVITVHRDGLQYMVGTDEAKVDEWISLY